MSHLFERPLCEMGRAYDFAFRPLVGDPVAGDGGGCDDRPHRVELYAADADPSSEKPSWLAFEVCPEHETQLRRYDETLRARGTRPRFRGLPGASHPPNRER